jgi:putative hydrolases of HD superfamily
VDVFTFGRTFRTSGQACDDLMPSKKMDSHRISDFWRLLERLKLEPRQGWKEKLRLRKTESVADHSYAVAMLALFHGWSRGGYDLERLLKLALLHDLDEAITGDLTPQDKRKVGNREVSRRKTVARRRIVSILPGRARSEATRLWADLRLGRSKEARLVKDIDQLEMVMQANSYSRVKGGEFVGPRVQEFYDSAVRRVKSPQLRKVVERIAKKDRLSSKR